MKSIFLKSPLALALAACAFSIQAAPAVSFKAPLANATVSGTLSGGACEAVVASSAEVSKVRFFVDGGTNPVGTADRASPWRCSIDTTKLSNGSHSLIAKATDATGAHGSAKVTVNVNNTSTPAPAAGPLDVWFKAPSNGATVSGVIQGTSCYVAGTGVSKVRFYVDNNAISTDSAVADGMQCVLDTTKLPNGAHQLKAKAWDATGATREDIISVSVSNTSSTPTPTPTPTPATGIDAADIVAQGSGDIPFAQQKNYNGQVLGTYPYVTDIPETGIVGPTLPNGERLRLGKAPDPLNPNRKALAFQLGPNDTATSGSHRSEIEFPAVVELNKTYWIALSLYVFDWGTLTSGDEALFGTQVHSGNSNLGLSPSFSMVSYGSKGGRTLQIFRTYANGSNPSSSNEVMYRYPEIPIRFGRWMDFVFKFRHATDSSGLLQVWMDGEQIVDYRGPLGFNTPGYRDYAKFGYYNWGNYDSSRKVLVRSPIMLKDPTGSKYGADTLRAAVQ